MSATCRDDELVYRNYVRSTSYVFTFHVCHRRCRSWLSKPFSRLLLVAVLLGSAHTMLTYHSINCIRWCSLNLFPSDIPVVTGAYHTFLSHDIIYKLSLPYLYFVSHVSFFELAVLSAFFLKGFF